MSHDRYIFIFVHLNVCFRKCRPEGQYFQHQEDPRTSKDSNSALLNNCQDYHWNPIWDFSVHVFFGVYGILQVGATAKWFCHVLCWRPFNRKLLVSGDCGAVFVNGNINHLECFGFSKTQSYVKQCFLVKSTIYYSLQCGSHFRACGYKILKCDHSNESC